MSRTARATINALFGYVRFGVTVIIGLWLVPFTLRHVGAERYGLWLASGELLAYAAMSEFGVLSTVPWLIADADGSGNRTRMRELVTTAITASTLSALVCAAASVVLWLGLPSIVKMTPLERDAVLGPVITFALLSVVAQPLRVFATVLDGLQDVKFNGAVTLVTTLLNALLTVVLLQRGYDLYALAYAAVVPMLVSGVWTLVRVGQIAPDLLRGWTWPGWLAVRSLFTQGFGTWVGGWGWRLISASDGLVLATLGNRTAVAALACTNKLAQALVQLSWVPCDGGLVGLAHLAGEQTGQRVHEAIVVMMRVYLALAGSVACVVLAMNPSFVTRWVGPSLFAGGPANILIALLTIMMTFGHALAVVPSVLGQRLQIGFATFACGIIHIGLAFALGFRFGILGIVIAGVISHGIVFSALAWRPFARATGMPETALFTSVIWPWARRMAPLAILAFAVEQVMGVPPLLVTVAAGGTMAAAGMWYMRPLYLTFGPVRALYDRFFQRFHLRLPSNVDAA